MSKCCFDGIEIAQDGVGEVVLLEEIPQVLGGIEFRAVQSWPRKSEQPDKCGNCS